MTGNLFKLEVRPSLPQELSGLKLFSEDLLYSWDRGVRGLFQHLDASLWEECKHNPKVFLRRVSQSTLEQAVDDHIYMEEYNRVLASYQAYHQKEVNERVENVLPSDKNLIAYFCAEFGLHESFPIYSGGLGILAGDHCKAASDLGLPFIAVGLLYRQGYFTQTIDGEGQQLAHYYNIDFDELPITPVLDSKRKPVYVSVDIESRAVKLKIWRAKVGHIQLYLLDSDLEVNTPDDRRITFQLYGGDKNTRIQQEIVLGIGGVRALRAMGIKPNIWHINEGHAAFQILERCREFVCNKAMSFDHALELVAAGTVFTTHTPVPAGHDIFERDRMLNYFSDYAKGLNIELKEFLALGKTPSDDDSFNMTALALHGSRFHNGVSRIHGTIASQMESYIWPQLSPEENPISYVTNGVHVPTFLAKEWLNLFNMRFSDWRSQLLSEEYWQAIEQIPDHRFWSLRKELKAHMLKDVHRRIVHRMERAELNDAILKRVTQFTSQPENDVLVLGFARRFATYKRATLLFSDTERLARLVNDPERPVMFVFAGKAHPKDHPGQELIKSIHQLSLQPEFQGKLILLEGYDISLARSMVTGVDVWINTPEYPLEASGTSGQKAAINGVINLSVLDGWWGEGYNGENGWAVHPHSPDVDPDIRNQEEADELFNILEQEVIPVFYDQGHHGYSPNWIKMAKESMKSCIPQFNAQRMVVDYLENFYHLAGLQAERFSKNETAPARELAQWKQKIHEQWNHISAHRTDEIQQQIKNTELFYLQIEAYLAGLSASDVRVECLVGKLLANGEFSPEHTFQLEPEGSNDANQRFTLNLTPKFSGLNHYKIRIYPYHELLSHPFEMGYMLWL